MLDGEIVTFFLLNTLSISESTGLPEFEHIYKAEVHL